MEESKTVGRPAKKDVGYVKLDMYEVDMDVLEWIERAKECVRLLGKKGDDATGYVLYHIRGCEG